MLFLYMERGCHIRIDKFTYMYCWFGNNVDMEGNQEKNSQTKKLERINFRVF